MNLKYRNQRNAEIVAAYWKKPLDKPDWFTIQAATKDAPAEAFIYGPIGWPYVCEDELIRAMAGMRDEPILARINTPGGDVFAGIAIANCFANHPGGVTARIESLAASIGSVVPMGCRKIEAYSNSMMMIHNSWIVTVGNRVELLELADILEIVDDNIMESYTKKTKIGKKEMRDMLAAETYMNAATMKAKGFIDEIIPSGRGAKATFDLSIFANLPDEFKAEATPKKITERELERGIRDVFGLSESKAKAIITGCKKANGEVDEKEAQEIAELTAAARKLIDSMK